ncbi:N-acetylmuramoyl-L-alanine amidase [Streptomyces sp. SBT349]|uniref:peptidoglycan recognition protein family protein n=1 Tax=Streptomyces sp. SBT349 TaxID=1580539 RepID=UPI00069EAF0E|nr:N-acetylmuramoyl-L-alanine amidase [Streptomyces sp. SBT349]
MAWYPGATRMELLPEARQQDAIRPTQFIVHSIVAPWEPRRTYEFWRDSTNLESHFGLGYSGDLGQYLPTTVRADANAGANRRADGTGAISVETASNTSASDLWTGEQVEALIALGAWAHRTHGIPLHICRSASDPGFGWHRLHRGWSTSGTACPGARRIEQFERVVFPGIVARSGQPVTTPAPPEEDEVPKFLALGMTEPIEIRDAGAWVSLPWDTEWSDGASQHGDGAQSFAADGAQYVGVLQLRLSGLAPGVEVQVRVVEDGPDGEKRLPIAEATGTAGGSYPALPLCGQVSRGARVKVMLAHFGPGPVTIERAELKAQVWP